MTSVMNKMTEVLGKYGVILEEKALNELANVIGKEEKNGKKEKKEPNIMLPYSGVIEEGCCRAMKVNYGLHSQCQTKVNGEEELCKVCRKQSEKNIGGEPDGGRIEVRQKLGENYKDKNGKAPTAYVTVMRKQGLTREMVLEYVKSAGLTLEESHLDEKKEKSEKEKKDNKDVKRGRPKNAKKEVEVSSTEDLFATLILEAKSEVVVLVDKVDKVEVEVEVEVAATEVKAKAKAKRVRKAKVATTEANAVVEVATKAVEEVATKAVEEVTTKAVEEVTTKAVEEVTTKAVVEVATKAVEEVATKAVEEVTTKAVEEVTTKAVEEVTTKAVEEVTTKAVVEVTTKAVVEVTTTEPKAKAVKEPKAKAVKEPKAKAVKEPKAKAVKEPKVAAIKPEVVVNIVATEPEVVASVTTTEPKAKAAKEPKAKAQKVEKVEKVEKKTEIAVLKQVVPKSEEEEEEEEVSVSKVEIKGKTYLKSKNNILYDVKTQDQIGMWNEAKQEIDYSELEEEDESDEDE